jgi:two-component system C4-dicarboxylate transport sensor histidine kinase DctB
VLIVIGLLITVKVSHWYGLEKAYAELNKQALLHLSNLTSYIERTLVRFEKVPEVISRHPLLSNVLLQPQNVELQQRLNHLLTDLQSVTEASDIFLINSLGTTVAASNWQQKKSFVGDDFSFRPYFLQAINDQAGRYYAVGVSSDKRGYYFSFPVKKQQVILGVIVVKVSIDEIEKQREKTSEPDEYHFLITAPDNVIFISDRSDWQLKTLGELPQSKNTLIAMSKRYGNREILPLPINIENAWGLPSELDARIVKLKSPKPERYFAINAKMPSADWRVHIWSALTPIEQQASFITLLSSSFYLMALILLLFIKERIKNSQQLRKSRQLLEQRVAERTAELTKINQRLTEEIQEREKTEQALKETQEELIQSAKLALIGNMSASINHEIRQPLTALRSYAQNTLAFQQRGLLKQANKNIEIMIGLIDRLSNIVSQFKHFTQKSNHLNKAVNLQECIRSALTIVEHLFHQAQCELQFSPPEQPLYCLGDEIRLEQVFVNLFSNAIQAMTEQENKLVCITLEQKQQQVCIVIRDNGPGIVADNFDKIFQPFFSTKENFGLGLGLSISQRIVESMQGTLTVQNHQSGGAEFIICLPIYQPK